MAQPQMPNLLGHRLLPKRPGAMSTRRARHLLANGQAVHPISHAASQNEVGTPTLHNQLDGIFRLTPEGEENQPVGILHRLREGEQRKK